MKNIHLIPTDKPSRLYKVHDKFYTEEYPDKMVTVGNQNIHITSDEEIKEGDWIYNEQREPSLIQCIGKGSLRGWKKIILTTDPDLIADGVQEIDGDFLEQFVQNPSCESVEVDKNWNYPLDKSWEYKLRIIPQEEPKQETLEEASWRYNPVKKLDGEFIRQAFKEGASWQAKQDQKTIDKLVSIIQWYDDESDVRPDAETFMWFEQFKKK